jgi:threonylcarbamoyladenosine tRNA methylthiotransferase MtaB
MKFYIYTLGCKVNTYESNVMHDLLINAGYLEGHKEDADIIIVNTCSVTNMADKKSLKMVHQARKNNPNCILVVAGCSVQNKKEEFDKDHLVDILIGNQNKSKIVEYIEEYKRKNNKKIDIEDVMHIPFENMALNNFHQTRAFVKIQDGCNNFCAYCIIPYVRGGVRSKELPLVLEEVKNLVKEGKKEIVLTGIHTGNYGRDKKTSLSDLLIELVKIEGLERIRISSIEVTELDDAFMEVLKNEKMIVDHMHIPLQSGSDTILKYMNRKYDKTFFLKKLEELRTIRKDISITTDVIVGFPYETEELFEETIDTIKKAKFTKIHVFPYSKREGTLAASMDHQIDEKVKKERVKILLTLSEELEKGYMEKFLHKELEVLPEIEKDGYLIGHTGNYLQVKYKGDKEDINTIIKVKAESLSYPYIEGIKIDE